VYQAAEKTMLDASRFIFSFAVAQCVPANDTETCVNNRELLGKGPGLSCAVELMNFFIGILNKAVTEPGKGKHATASTKRHHASSASLTTLSDASLAPEMQELLLALKGISVTLLGDGNLDACRALIMRYGGAHLFPRLFSHFSDAPINVNHKKMVRDQE
jgi:hypothetical protein